MSFEDIWKHQQTAIELHWKVLQKQLRSISVRGKMLECCLNLEKMSAAGGKQWTWLVLMNIIARAGVAAPADLRRSGGKPVNNDAKGEELETWDFWCAEQLIFKSPKKLK